MASPIEYMAEVVKSLTTQVCEALSHVDQVETRNSFLQDELDKATKAEKGAKSD